MAFADDLLMDARHLAVRGGERPRQSSLRRAVSTAYYALFHLLTADFVLNWRIADQRAILGRMFEDRKMRQASFKPKSRPLTAAELDLKTVIDAFIYLQDHRNTADYDVALIWGRRDVEDTLTIAEEAFKAWGRIRKDKIAQEHLLKMFGARQTRSQTHKNNPLLNYKYPCPRVQV